MRIPHAIYAGLFASALIGAPAALADPARDNLVRAEAQISALNPADATAASPEHYQSAQLRLGEARAAEDKNRDEESMWRSEEALLHAEIVQEHIKLRGINRTVAEIEKGIETLRRELVS